MTPARRRFYLRLPSVAALEWASDCGRMAEYATAVGCFHSHGRPGWDMITLWPCGERTPCQAAGIAGWRKGVRAWL